MRDSRIRTVGRAARLAACAGAAATGAVAQANWFLSYTSANWYEAKFTQVPDFDQNRNGLPNGGSAYCVPTAEMNWSAYFASHGLPSQAPGDADYLAWQWSAPKYNEITGNVGALGTFMGTDASDGTYGSGHLNGLSRWLAPNVLVMRFSFSGGATPDFDGIAKWVVQGVPVTAGVGWYKGTAPFLSRDGGHAISVVRVARTGSVRVIGFHDPGDDDLRMSTQSLFSRQDYNCETQLVILPGGVPRQMDKVIGYGSGYVDSYTVMIPMFSLSTSDDATRILIKKIVQMPIDPWTVREILAPEGSTITDVAIAPYQPVSYFSMAPVVGGQPGLVFKYDHVEDQVVETRVEATDPRAMCIGRNGELYVLDGTTVRCFDVSQEPEVQTAAASFDKVWAMTYNDVTDEMVVLIGDRGDQVVRLGLGLVPPTTPPTTLPAALTIKGVRSLGASPVTGDLFLTSTSSPGVYHFPGSAPPDSPLTTFTLIGAGEIPTPQDLTVGDHDRVYVSANGVRKVFKQDPASGLWSQDEANPAHNRPANRREKTAISRSNFDPATMVGPGFRHVQPTEFSPPISVCLMDLNDDGGVNGADLGVLLGAWGTANADLNGNGVTDGADLGLMLGAWGQCPGQP